ncbi:hypothetical protein [Roseibium aggregatum]|uniref:Uncharacterized protein n=1 Tax=Roseibium aggregatum TaxID=187304 RepID=A0A939EE98_9HYPH|nr:hypothetical protein [Roseibium aggregatum]MBN9671656.1 hypothetical protein [Roseibium aggregatum]
MIAGRKGGLAREERWNGFGADGSTALDGAADVGEADAGKSRADVVFALAWGHDEVVADFDPRTGIIIIDRLGEAKLQFAETATGVILSVPSNNQALTLAGLKLRDLRTSNFRVSDDGAAGEVLEAIATALMEPAPGETERATRTKSGAEWDGCGVVYDNDGANPPVPSGVSDAGGVTWPADFSADDIIGFNPVTDTIDFDSPSANGAVLNMTPVGEAIIDDPRGPEMQILQGMLLSDLSAENFGHVSHKHLRLDIGGILSWEKGLGPRKTDTVYIRSHEYGVTQIIEDFDPLTQKISFLYFGGRFTRVEDTPGGMEIRSLPSGQKFIFSGVTKADLVARNMEFRWDQVLADNLADAFGLDPDDVYLVSTKRLLTPKGPGGAPAKTDRDHSRQEAASETGTTEAAEIEGVPGAATSSSAPEAKDDDVSGADLDTSRKFQDWGREFVALSLNPEEDMLDFRDLRPSGRQIKPVGRKILVRAKKKRGDAAQVKTRNNTDTLM